MQPIAEWLEKLGLGRSAILERIHKGERADLPVQTLNQSKLVTNLKTAKASRPRSSPAPMR